MSVKYGYAGKILKVDLSSTFMTDLPSSDYANRFLGGLGIATKIAWDELPDDVGPLDAENRLMFFTGPLAGVHRVGGSRWFICGKTPAAKNGQFANTSGGGNWGAFLKFAGYDGIVIHGKSEKPVYLLIRDGVPELRDASAIWGKTTRQASSILKNELGSQAGVVAIGPAGENEVSMACVVADDLAVGASGFGAVMGSKKLKAIAVMGGSREVTVADHEKIESVVKYIQESVEGRPQQCNYTPYPWASDKITPLICYGCMRAFACVRAKYKASDGETGKLACQAGDFYTTYAMLYYGDYYDTQFKATLLANDYGLDTYMGIEPILGWLSACYTNKLITEEQAELPLSKMGSLEFIEAFIKKISYRDGFGDVLAGGLVNAMMTVGGETTRIHPLSNHFYWPEHQSLFDPRLLITSGILLASEPKRRIANIAQTGHLTDFYWYPTIVGVKGYWHDWDYLRTFAKKYWGSEVAIDFTTYEGKALAAKMIQDHKYAFDSLGLCSWAWPLAEYGGIVSGDHFGDTTLESQLYSAVTGNKINQEELYRMGERIFNLERALLVRGRRNGREGDTPEEWWFNLPMKAGLRLGQNKCWVPGKDGKLIIKDGAVLDREKFEAAMDEYYQFRGWDVSTGFQKKAKLAELELADVSSNLEKRGLVK